MLSLVIDRALAVETTLLVNDLSIWPGRPPLYDNIPIGWAAMWRLLRRLRIERDDVFYDVGAGNGRALVVAGSFPFRRLVGIERSAELHAMALANLSRCRLRARMQVEMIHGDALLQPFPEDATVVFFYNPFEGETFDRFIAHMLAAIDQRPRPLRFVYHNPVEHDRLLATGRFKLIDRMRGLRLTRDWSRMLSTHVYEVSSA